MCFGDAHRKKPGMKKEFIFLKPSVRGSLLVVLALSLRANVQGADF